MKRMIGLMAVVGTVIILGLINSGCMAIGCKSGYNTPETEQRIKTLEEKVQKLEQGTKRD